ncbi:putative WRKY transcription factor 70 [Carex littledalei]|uniref:Putative WRKY transcription factor 70 n=1 Tax=Carex littledalei TaxID=544730 RepID=A0A833VA10_9POAL|nr:putative WRKY transcription factor 70 [Carex littledalei]
MALSNIPKKNLNWILKDLLKGQESAHRLNALIKGSVEARNLMGEILNGFSTAITALQNDEALKETGLTESADLRSEISNKKRKSFDGSDQRSGSRRSIRQGPTRVIHANTIEDGQAWRKYGQKGILNSKNPRSYFRCTHKFDQGCKAQKQSQKSEEDPTIFIITYIGNHTCNNVSPLPQIIENFSPDNSSCLISFESNTATSNNNNKLGQDNIVTPSVQTPKLDGEDDVLSNLTMADLSLTAGGDSDPITQISEQAEDRDVTSGLNCPIGDLDMHLMGTEFDLGDLESFCHLI